MKTWNVIVKIVVALAAIAGIVYVAATYGERITAWAKKLLRSLPLPCTCGCGCECDCDCSCEDTVAEQADFEG